jgi:hypothetical protein
MIVVSTQKHQVVVVKPKRLAGRFVVQKDKVVWQAMFAAQQPKLVVPVVVQRELLA